MSGALAARHAEKELDKGRIEKTRVKRYWPGKAPEWAEDDDTVAVAREVVRTDVAAPVIVRKYDDPRLQRLAASRVDRDEAIEKHREIRAAEIVRRQEESASEAEDEGESSEEEEEIDAEEHERKRQLIRQRLLEQRQEEELLQQEEEEEEEEEEESEYESESDDDAGGRRLIKPVFVPKTERDTIAEREELEREEAAAREKEKQRLEERKLETRQMVIERIALDERAAQGAQEGPKGEDEVNTDDDLDDEAEYEAWKARELRRIQRDREEREAYEKEQEEREKLKNMTEEERAAWERANPKVVAKAPKKKWKFLQKYWHRGAYFQDDPDDPRGTTGRDGIFLRDYSGPTGEDKFDKSILPKVMQVRNFGRSGRTKWTHLVAEDTTDFATAMAPKPTGKRATDPQEFAKPKKFKR